MIVRWNGDDVVDKVAKAAAEAVDETTAAAAAAAKSSHWWRSRSGTLERQTVTEPATVDRDDVVGKFGTTERLGFYGLILERRRPFLRPAADREFPKLAERIERKVG